MIKPVDIKFADLPIENIGLERDSCAEVFRLTGGLDANIRLWFSSYGLQRRSEVILESGEIVQDVWIRYA